MKMHAAFSGCRSHNCECLERDCCVLKLGARAGEIGVEATGIQAELAKAVTVSRPKKLHRHPGQAKREPGSSVSLRMHRLDSRFRGNDEWGDAPTHNTQKVPKNFYQKLLGHQHPIYQDALHVCIVLLSLLINHHPAISIWERAFFKAVTNTRGSVFGALFSEKCLPSRLFPLSVCRRCTCAYQQQRYNG